MREYSTYVISLATNVMQQTRHPSELNPELNAGCIGLTWSYNKNVHKLHRPHNPRYRNLHSLTTRKLTY